MNSSDIVDQLKILENPGNIAGMARFGINPQNTLGISVKDLRAIGRDIKNKVVDQEKLHELAQGLWESEIHEARILATIIDQPKLVTEKQLDSWVKDIDSWDICDGFCLNLVDKTQFAFQKVPQWAQSDGEFIRRAAFSLLAGLAVHDKKAADEQFLQFLPLIKKYSTDERNFVKKSVSWSLRQIGKRNKNLLKKSIELAEDIEKIDSKSARWVAKDALRELRERT